MNQLSTPKSETMRQSSHGFCRIKFREVEIGYANRISKEFGEVQEHDLLLPNEGIFAPLIS